MADDRADLDERFADLDTVPVPPWRERTLAKLDAVPLLESSSAELRPRRSGFAIAAVVLLVVMATAAVAVLRADPVPEVATSAPGDAPSDSSPAEPGAAQEADVYRIQVTGAPLPPELDGRAIGMGDGATPASAPAIRGRDLDGAELAVTPGDGIARIVVFVAHWCPHCRDELPVIADWIRAGGLPDGVELVVVSTSEDEAPSDQPPSVWLRSELAEDGRWLVPVMVDDDEDRAARAYALAAFPTHVAIDGGGAVVDYSAGELGADGLDALVRAVGTGG